MITVVRNVVLPTFVGVPWTIQVATAAVMVGATGAGASILHASGLRLADSRAAQDIGDLSYFADRSSLL